MLFKKKNKDSNDIKRIEREHSAYSGFFAFVRYKNSNFVPNKKLNITETIINTTKYLFDKNYKQKVLTQKLERASLQRQERHKALVKFLKDELVRDSSDYKTKYIQIDTKFADVLTEVLHDSDSFSEITFEVLDINENYKLYAKKIPFLVECTRIEEEEVDEESEDDL